MVWWRWFPLNVIDFSVILLILLVLEPGSFSVNSLAADAVNWSWLPHFNGLMNLVICSLLTAGYLAIRRGNKTQHPKWMVTACVFGAIFLVGYILQTVMLGHQKFPGDDWVRVFFLTVLTSHTILAVLVVPCIFVVLRLAMRGAFEKHKRFARVTLAIWVYVSVTGLYIYLMNNHVRPAEWHP